MGIFDGVVGSTIGVLGNLATTKINDKYQQEQWNREVAHEQSTYERNRADYLADLEKEREYNSPAQQMARMHEAGINPNLQGGAGLSSGQSSPATPMPSGNNIGMGPVTASDFSDGIAKVSTAAVNAVESRARAAKLYADADLQSELGLTEREMRPIKKDLVRAEIAKENGQTQVYLKQCDKLVEDTLMVKQERTQAKEIFSKTLKNLDADYNVKMSTVGKNIEEKNYYYAKTLTESLVQDFQRVATKKEKVTMWTAGVRDICTSLGAIGVGLGSLKTLFKSAGAGLKGNDKKTYDEAVENLFGNIASPSHDISTGENSEYGFLGIDYL